MQTKQYLLTVSAGKRLIAKAVAALPTVKRALISNTVVVTAGTTNGYVAEELLASIGAGEGFNKAAFYRGATTAPGRKAPTAPAYQGDLVLERGRWLRGRDIQEIGASLGHGDVLIKGANAIDAAHAQAGILIGNPMLGTCMPVLQAVVGRRVELILPVGLEKRVTGDIHAIASLVNAPDATGLRMLPVTGTIVTELEAITTLTGATAQLVAAGGVFGAEGACWVAVSGTAEQLAVADVLIASVSHEAAFGE